MHRIKYRRVSTQIFFWLNYKTFFFVIYCIVSIEETHPIYTKGHIAVDNKSSVCQRDATSNNNTTSIRLSLSPTHLTFSARLSKINLYYMFTPFKISKNPSFYFLLISFYISSRNEPVVSFCESLVPRSQDLAVDLQLNRAIAWTLKHHRQNQECPLWY